MGGFLPRFFITSQPESQPRPPYINQLNDSVYQLYAPTSRLPSVEVIFFHGLEQDQDYKEAFWKTWLSRDGKVVWPEAWLSGDLPQARMLSISYNSAAQRERGQIDNYLLAENLIDDIICGDVKAGQNCPVILVGHCLGGLIIKAFLLGCMGYIGISSKIENAQWKVKLIENFLSNWKGVFYYGTPHAGSEIADYLVKVKGRSGLNEQVIELLSLLNTRTTRINDQFAKARIGEKIRSEAVGETLETKYMEFEGILVKEASARYNVDEFYTAKDANHFQVCKAKNAEWCSIYKRLYDFIERILKDNGSRTNAEGNATTSEEKPGIKLLQSLNL